MSNTLKHYKYIHTIILVVAILFLQLPAHTQEKPPRPIAIYVSPEQGLSFGAIIPGVSGGTVIVYPDGSRSKTGDIVLGNFGFSWSPALFEVEANIGTLITIQNGPNVNLTGSNGGTMSMEIGDSDPVSPFVTTVQYPTRTSVKIGGTLTVGSLSANPAGSYSGTFIITFIQE